MNRNKLFFIIVLFLCVLSAKAQFSNIRTGLSLAKSATIEIGGEDYSNHNLGIYADAHYQLGNKFYLVPGLELFVPRKESFSMGGESKTTLLNFYADGYYYFTPSSDLSAYLIGGLNVAFWHIQDQHETAYFGDVDVKENKILPALSAGLGFRYEVTYKSWLFTQARIVIGSSNQLVWTNGLQVSLD